MIEKVQLSIEPAVWWKIGRYRSYFLYAMHIYNGFEYTYSFTSESGGKIRLGSTIISTTTLSAQ
jgi:hypothetical protein